MTHDAQSMDLTAFARAERAWRKYRRIAEISAPRRRGHRWDFTLDEIMATTLIREAIEEKVAKETERLRQDIEQETEPLRQEIDRWRQVWVDATVTIMRLRFPNDDLHDTRDRLQQCSHDELCAVSELAATAASAADARHASGWLRWDRSPERLPPGVAAARPRRRRVASPSRCLGPASPAAAQRRNARQNFARFP